MRKSHEPGPVTRVQLTMKRILRIFSQREIQDQLVQGMTKDLLQGMHEEGGVISLIKFSYVITYVNFVFKYLALLKRKVENMNVKLMQI